MRTAAAIPRFRRRARRAFTLVEILIAVGILTIVVKDEHGRTVYTLDEGRDLRQGIYKVQVEVTVQGWEKGRYAICFATDGVLLKKQEFEL